MFSARKQHSLPTKIYSFLALRNSPQKTELIKSFTDRYNRQLDLRITQHQQGKFKDVVLKNAPSLFEGRKNAEFIDSSVCHFLKQNRLELQDIFHNQNHLRNNALHVSVSFNIFFKDHHSFQTYYKLLLDYKTFYHKHYEEIQKQSSFKLPQTLSESPIRLTVKPTLRVYPRLDFRRLFLALELTEESKLRLAPLTEMQNYLLKNPGKFGIKLDWKKGVLNYSAEFLHITIADQFLTQRISPAEVIYLNGILSQSKAHIRNNAVCKSDQRAAEFTKSSLDGILEDISDFEKILTPQEVEQFDFEVSFFNIVNQLQFVRAPL